MTALRQRVQAVAARILARLPVRLVRLLAGHPIVIEGQELDPRVQLALRLEGYRGAFEPAPVAEVRERRRGEARAFAGPRIEVAGVRELQIPGPAGPIAARLYAPRTDAQTPPMIVYYHGGGHVIGDLDTHEQPCRFLAAEVPALVLSIDYRLGPEHRFPAAVEDSMAAFEWAHAEAASLGADPDRIVVAGDSAGANLAAVVAHQAATAGGPAPAFQALLYPVIDYSSKRPSYETFAEGFFLTRAEMDWFRDHYFADLRDRIDPRASPILAEDLAGVAPAHVVTAGFDPLRDEGEDYAAALREAGVAVSLRREPDLVHGFVNAVGLGGRPREAAEAAAAAIRDGLRAR